MNQVNYSMITFHKGIAFRDQQIFGENLGIDPAIV